MGYWENTAYIATGNSALIADHIVCLSESEGMLHIPRPPQRERVLVESMQYQTALENNMWALAVFPGSPGWTVIKTAPLDLLGEISPATNRIRFVDLCTALQAPGFILNIYDGSSGAVLVETDGTGKQALSGHAYPHDPLSFYGTPMSEEYLEIQFRYLTDLQSLIDHSHYPGSEYTDYEKLSSQVATTLGGLNSSYCDNLTSVDTLISHKPLSANDGIDIYFKWPSLDRQEYPRMGSWEEFIEWKKNKAHVQAK